MDPVTPVPPVTMALNQEVEEEGNWSQSDCDLCDSPSVTAHVTSSILGFTSQDASDLDDRMKYHWYKTLQDVIEEYYTKTSDQLQRQWSPSHFHSSSSPSCKFLLHGHSN